MSCDLTHVIIQWQTDKSISLLPKNDVLGIGEELKTDDKVTARYNNKLLPAKVLFSGGQEEMERQMAKIEPGVKSIEGTSDSPKGRGHRAVKRKQLPADFVSDVSDVKEDIKQGRSATLVQSNLQKKARSDAGHDIIEMLLKQRVESPAVSKTSAPELSSDEDSLSDDSEQTMSRVDFLRHQNQLLKTNLDEAETKLKESQKKVTELERNILKCLPNIVGQLQGMIGEYRQALRVAPTKRAPAPAALPLETTEKSPPRPLVSTDACRPSSASSTSPSTSSPASPSTPSSEASLANSSELEQSVLDPGKVSKALATSKDFGKLVCSLMRAGFSRKEMATSSITGKSKDGTPRSKLDPGKVEEVMKLTLQKFGETSRSSIRVKIAEKLKDERIAYNREQKEMRKENINLEG